MDGLTYGCTDGQGHNIMPIAILRGTKKLVFPTLKTDPSQVTLHLTQSARYTTWRHRVRDACKANRGVLQLTDPDTRQLLALERNPLIWHKPPNTQNQSKEQQPKSANMHITMTSQPAFLKIWVFTSWNNKMVEIKSVNNVLTNTGVHPKK